MTKTRKKLTPPTAATLVKTMARARIGSPPPEKVVPDPRRKPEKHKRDLRREPDSQ